MIFGTGARPGANVSFLARGHAQDNDFSTGARPGAQTECMRAPTEQINKIIEIYFSKNDCADTGARP